MTTYRSATTALAAAVALVITAPLAPVVSAQRGVSVPNGVLAVRQALGHGDVSAARQAAEAATGDGRELSTALVELFVGQDDAARARLAPLAERQPLGEAALELGLLDLRRGRREEADRRLRPIASVRQFTNADDYLRLARAAIGIREYLLANDAFDRVSQSTRADIQSAWGDLFLSRHQPADAAQSYRDAITADPKWVPALVGLSRAYADDEPEAADTALEEARKAAPDHPDVLLRSAEVALDEEDAAAAKAALDRLARVRPGSVEEAGLRVALAYEDGGAAAVPAAIEAVRAADPRSAIGYRLAGERAAFAYRFAEASDFARKATETDPDDPQAFFDLGLYLMRTGDEGSARAALERSWDLDKSAPVTKNLLDLLDKIDAYTTVEAPNMIFRFAPNEAEVLKVYAVPLAEQAYATFQKTYGFTPEGPILIEVFPRHDDFAVRTMGLPGLVGALGACFGRVITMDSPAAPGVSPFSWHATLWHEMAHVFSLQLSQYRVPRWLTEGISTFEEHRKVPAWGRELTLEYGRAMATGETFGVKGLPDAFKRPEHLAMAYFEASLVVEHLVDLNGDQGLQTLLKAYAEGASDQQAFARAFGRSVDEVDASFHQFVQERFGALAKAMAPPASEAAADNLPALEQRAAGAPGNFISQLTYGQALVREGRLDAAKAPLERAAALAPMASGDGSPRALLAMIAEQAGNQAGAREEYRDLLQADHTNVNAARRLLAVSGGSTDDQFYALRLIADLDPFDADAHGQLGRRLFAQDDYEAALLEFQASLALGPPNLAEAHSDVAETYLKLGKRDEAKQAALEALKEAPTFVRAQELLLQAIGRAS
ncbi:MAG: peptidase MA family metallohydrolase [Vicinamibacterales bacterium]